MVIFAFSGSIKVVTNKHLNIIVFITISVIIDAFSGEQIKGRKNSLLSMDI